MASTAQAEAPRRSTTLFEDFDDETVFQKAAPHAADQDSKNFVVEFGPEHARVAFNLGADDFHTLLQDERHIARYPIRWINIWDPSVQKDAITAIGNQYDFSERLIRLMALALPKAHTAEARRRKDRTGHVSKHRHPQKDLETGNSLNGNIPLDSIPSLRVSKEAMNLELMDDDGMELFLQVKNTVNYFSTDQTRKAMIIGAHWLHKRPAREHEPQRKSMMPPKHWQWLALCNDHTLLSIHEKPSFEPTPEKEDEQTWQSDELKNIRANTLDVLLQLSQKGFDLYKRKPLSQNSVRRPLYKWLSSKPDLTRQETGMSFASKGEPVSLADEGTSNLFYYLFEDYVAAGPLKTAEGKLEHITHKVLESARPKVRSKSTDIIPTLHYLSKDLRELKHMFENYKNLVGKIMASGKAESQVTNGPPGEIRRVALTDSAQSRFDRLGDRLQFLMLNTIEGYLEEISALSSTYFNLTQQKDSEATARLTRSATLLAKLSVFFLPISFLTSYFSIQIEDLYSYWHAKDYWYSFAVIASVSFVSLFFFSRLLMFFSDVMDDWASHIARWFRRIGQYCGLDLKDDDDP
ncbi:Uu.00g014220.m01.CDS01 [Anthostomella pinea]|uniref:Uu.00g014220.m01.CDS01 n=1 Tax=Anthostomella pinea TaxID=933095 RepID=A0AAI8VZI2_9PEZI|nr:Uu.00g014220.m01.CDS01 [Anthostomella pinea]